MRSTASYEIEYLGQIDGGRVNRSLIREMSQRLDALRRFDQSFSEADCRPQTIASEWRPNSVKERS